MIYITSDLHFGHDKEFLYSPRGFTTIQEHDEELIRRWNSIVNFDDDVYILGDLMLGDDFHGVQCVGQLNGNLKIILGNHDTDKRIAIYKGGWLGDCKNIEVLGYGAILKYKKFRFYLSHYPTLCANWDDGKFLGQHTINLCGHTHTQDKFVDMNKGIIYHCEMDAHNCAPVSIENIITDLKDYYYNIKE